MIVGSNKVDETITDGCGERKGTLVSAVKHWRGFEMLPGHANRERSKVESQHGCFGTVIALERHMFVF
jgi:hypothetical protein